MSAVRRERNRRLRKEQAWKGATTLSALVILGVIGGMARQRTNDRPAEPPEVRVSKPPRPEVRLKLPVRRMTD